MAIGGGIKVQMSGGAFKALLSACQYMIKNFKERDQWNMLLLWHLVQLRNSIAKRIIDNKTKTLSLSTIETYAYWLLWMQVDLDTSTFNPEEKQVIQKVLDEVDRYVKSQNPLKEYEQNLLG